MILSCAVLPLVLLVPISLLLLIVILAVMMLAKRKLISWIALPGVPLLSSFPSICPRGAWLLFLAVCKSGLGPIRMVIVAVLMRLSLIVFISLIVVRLLQISLFLILLIALCLMMIQSFLLLNFSFYGAA